MSHQALLTLASVSLGLLGPDDDAKEEVVEDPSLGTEIPLIVTSSGSLMTNDN